MSVSGPVPKRSTERRRKNKPSGPELATAPTRSDVVWTPADPEWHQVAQDWYASLSESGQNQFYEPSDVAAARYVAEAMSRNLHSGRFSGQLFAAVMGAMTELLTTEGARRRARIELERGEPAAEPASVTSMAKYKKAAQAKAS